MDEKDAYQKRIEARLEQLNAKIQELKAKLKEKQAGSKAEYYERIDDLKRQRDEVRANLEHLKQSSSEAWQTLRAGLDDALKDLQDAFDRAVDSFKSRPKEE